MSAKRWLVWALIAIATGLTIFGITVAQVTSVDRLELQAAVAQIDSVRATLGDLPPVIQRDESGEVAIEPSPEVAPGKIRTLRVLAYRRASRALLRSHVPVWFMRMKAPVVEYLLRDTGVDLGELGLSMSDILRHGPRILLDDELANGDRVLIWTSGSDGAGPTNRPDAP